MTRNEWQEAIYAALGIPEAVTDKKGIAAELLERRSAPPSAGPANPAAPRREAARAAVLTGLAACLEDGALDRLLVNLEDVETVASRLAATVGDEDGPDDLRERKVIVDLLLPGLLGAAKVRVTRQRLSLPAALGRPPA